MNRPFKIQTTLCQSPMSAKLVVMLKHLLLLCILVLLTSCISDNWLFFCKPGITAQTHLSGVKHRSAESLARDLTFDSLVIKYDEIDKQNHRLNEINLLVEGKCVNLGSVKHQEILSIDPINKSCKKEVQSDPYLGPSICFDYLNGNKLVARISFSFNQDKRIEEVMCYCLDAQGRGLIKFEKIAGKEVFEMPFKVEDLKTMFGDDAQIFTQFFW